MCVKSVHFLWDASDVTPASSQPSCCPVLRLLPHLMEQVWPELSAQSLNLAGTKLQELVLARLFARTPRPIPSS